MMLDRSLRSMSSYKSYIIYIGWYCRCVRGAMISARSREIRPERFRVDRARWMRESLVESAGFLRERRGTQGCGRDRKSPARRRSLFAPLNALWRKRKSGLVLCNAALHFTRDCVSTKRARARAGFEKLAWESASSKSIDTAAYR
jgi:hypothetical protein